MRRSLFAIIFIAFALSGCATTWLVDSDVRAFSKLPANAAALAPAPYRMEWLPSQTDPAARATLTEWAAVALARIGWRRDDAAPRFSVQVDARVQRFNNAPWDDPWWGAWGPVGSGYIVGSRGHLTFGSGIGVGIGFGFPSNPYYQRSVSLLIRDLGSGQIVYETQAAHDGRWSDNATVFPAMFEAALRGFPNPPAGIQRVNIEVPR